MQSQIKKGTVVKGRVRSRREGEGEKGREREKSSKSEWFYVGVIGACVLEEKTFTWCNDAIRATDLQWVKGAVKHETQRMHLAQVEFHIPAEFLTKDKRWLPILVRTK